jgi:hypothetical protein
MRIRHHDNGNLLDYRIMFPGCHVKEISTPYFSDTNVLFIGGMMLAVAVEQWNLHKRIALKILLLIGTQPRRYIVLHCHITTPSTLSLSQAQIPGGIQYSETPT